MTLAVTKHEGGRPNVGGLATKDLASLTERLSAFELFQHKGVARLRQTPLAPVPCNKECVTIDPADVLLALWEIKAVRNEGLRGAIELSYGRGIRAAIGKTNQAEALFRRKAARTLKDPISVLGDGQGVHVEDGFPLWELATIALTRGAPPDAAHLVLVLPEMLQTAPFQWNICDPILLQDGERLFVEVTIARI